MIARDLDVACVPASGTVRDALRVIDGFAHSVALILDDAGVLAGLLTDGDLRRALLRGASLDDGVLPFATTSPLTCRSGTPRALVLDLMRARSVAVVPEIDDAGHLVGLHTLTDIVGGATLPNVAVVMAGGKGTRLGELTRTTPKPLVPVAGRSILEWIILNLVGGGIREIYVSVNHLADQIESALGDGTALGCTINYLRENEDEPLGTAGSLAVLRDLRPDLEDPLLVMNGDLMVEFNVRELVQHHRDQNAAVTVGVRPYQHTVPFGVVQVDHEGTISGISEKPTITMDINAAVYAVAPEMMMLVPSGRVSTMPELVEACIGRGNRVVAWPVSSDWIDIGTPRDLALARGLG